MRLKSVPVLISLLVVIGAVVFCLLSPQAPHRSILTEDERIAEEKETKQRAELASKLSAYELRLIPDWATLDLQIAECRLSIERLTDYASKGGENASLASPLLEDFKNVLDQLQLRRNSSIDECLDILQRRLTAYTKGTCFLEKEQPSGIHVVLPKMNGFEFRATRMLLERPMRLSFHVCPSNAEDSDAIASIKKLNLLGNTPDLRFAQYRVVSLERQDRFDSQRTSLSEIGITQIPILDAPSIRFAKAVESSAKVGSYDIRASFSPIAQASFSYFTSRIIGLRMAILFDGQAFSAPVVKETIRADCIFPLFRSKEETEAVACSLCFKPLPVGFKITEEHSKD